MEGTCTWVELSFTYTFDFSSIERVGLIVGGRGRPHPKMPTNREADPVLVNLEVGCVLCSVGVFSERQRISRKQRGDDDV